MKRLSYSDLSVLIVCNKTGGTIKGDINKKSTKVLRVFVCKFTAGSVHSVVPVRWTGPAGDSQMERSCSRSRYLCVCRPALRYQPAVNLTDCPHYPLHFFLRLRSAMGDVWRRLGCDAVSSGKEKALRFFETSVT